MPEIIIREIEEDDLENGFLETLDFLRNASDLDKNKANEILKKIKQNPNHIIYVAIDNKKIVGSTTLLIEQKFIHDGGLVGHIEDVVVRKDYEGKGIGIKLVMSMLERAKEKNCYKTILDCKDDVKQFYERIGFKRESNDELRQLFVDRTVKQADLIGLKIPDPALKWNPERKHYNFGEINWDEFWEVVNGNGFCNKVRINNHINAHAEGQWVREAALAYAEKTQNGV